MTVFTVFGKDYKPAKQVYSDVFDKTQENIETELAEVSDG